MRKVAIVTGGSRGLGKAISITLATENQYHVLVNYQSNAQAANDTVQEIEQRGGSAEAICFDVADGSDVQTKLSDWQEKHSEDVVEVVVNNAGITRDGLFMWMPSEDWHSVFNTSVHGFFNVTNFFIQRMLRHKHGRIINIVSVSGMKGTAGQTNYSAAKGAVIAATKALAQEVAKRNITVNAVAPGFIKTDMTKDLNESELKKLIPANRFGEAQEVADLVSFLASGKSSYITGEIVNINGGIYS